MEQSEDNKMEHEPASDKKLLKAQKKAEKLAKLEAKKATQKIIQPKAKKPASPSTTGYDPGEVEKYWTKYWLENQSFTPKNGEKGKFMMCIPPPNITGSLHIGHAMMIAIEDCIVRYKRLNGYEVLYLPGLDHAGIATQNVVMKSLGRSVDRKTFMEAAFEWSSKYGNRICEQFDRMGTSVDYTRKVFTLDRKVSRSVNTAFCTLYKKGLVYRDNKIVYWCGKLKTTLSDLEVNYKDIEGGSYIDVDSGRYKFGVMYYIKYHLCRSSNIGSVDVRTLPYIVIGTTRPETIPGDSAICVNPNDPRFSNIDEIFRNNQVRDIYNSANRDATKSVQHDATGCDEQGNMINEELKAERKNKYKSTKTVEEEAPRRFEDLFAINPLTGEVIPVILDSQADLSFGTGVLKITPCHDPVDFKIGKRHGLKFNTIMDENNRMTHPKYVGMPRFEARKAVISELKESGYLLKEENHTQVLPFCSRSNDIIESMVKEQWWCDCKEMARKAIEGVRSGGIEVYPEEAKSVWFRWLENIKDWCLSRQLWWGHRVPAYKASNGTKSEWIVAESSEEALRIAMEKGYDSIEQDEDVLDTWFSSGLWPFSTLGWPDHTADFERYFPNALLETGSDILFFWVARMVMLSYELTGSKPFDRILLHGIVRDAHGRKMSKSLGNVIDPLYVIDGIELDEMIANLHKGNLDPRETSRATDALKKDFPNGIPKCGADALRFTLLSYTNGMKDINLDILRVQGYSRLCNKLWNAYKFVDGATKQDITDCLENLNIRNVIGTGGEHLHQHHRWILSRLNQTIEDQHRHIEGYNFMMATQSVYQLFFDFCDNIIEVSKNPTETDKTVLRYVFLCILKLFHPFMPFITEDLHFRMCSRQICDYPEMLSFDDTNDFENILKLIAICRSKDKKSVMVEDFKDSWYITTLVRSGIEIVEKLDEYEEIGSLKYKIVKE